MRRIDQLREAHEAAVRLDEALHRLREWRKARGARWVAAIEADLRHQMQVEERREEVQRGRG